jgi:2'-5' RNA ligase
MRAFFAITLPEAITESLGALSQRLRLKGAKASWVPPQRMHLTLRFFGDITEEQCAGMIAAAVAPLAEVLAPEFLITGVGSFGRKGRPDVIWAGAQILAGDVEAILRAVDAAARAQGIEVENRPFRPHITLARIRDPRSAGALAAELGHEAGFAAGQFTCHNVTLYQSRLTPSGPEYSIIKEFPLRVT